MYSVIILGAKARMVRAKARMVRDMTPPKKKI